MCTALQRPKGKDQLLPPASPNLSSMCFTDSKYNIYTCCFSTVQHQVAGAHQVVNSQLNFSPLVQHSCSQTPKDVCVGGVGKPATN